MKRDIELKIKLDYEQSFKRQSLSVSQHYYDYSMSTRLFSFVKLYVPKLITNHYLHK